MSRIYNTKFLNHTCKFLWLFTVLYIAGILSACDGNLRHSLNMAGDNREELEKVLCHFKRNPDPLKYKAAIFLIENMPYHYSFEGSGIEQYDSAYLVMTGKPLQMRDSAFRVILETIDFSETKYIPDIKNLDADRLILIIDEACNTWRDSSWSKNYPEEIFLEYVLPYRIYNEQLSDWLSTVDEEFPYLTSHSICSKRGPMIQAEDCATPSAPIALTESASGGKMRILTDSSSKVPITLNSPLPSKKFITLRFTASDKDAVVRLFLNGKPVGNLALDPTQTMKIFRNSRKGIEVELPAGTSTLIIEGLHGKVGLDYVMVSTVEDAGAIPDEDFSKTYWRIKNMDNNHYLTFDTTEVLRKTELLPFAEVKDNATIRLDYQGYKCWSISELTEKSGQLCLEAQYCSTDENSYAGQYCYINGNHQKWIFIPLKDGLYRIMGKGSGLSLEALTDSDGTKRIIQTSYAGKDSQKWRLEPLGNRKVNHSVFYPGNAMDKAFKVFDVTDSYEWISYSGGIMPKAASLLRGKTGNCRDEAAFTVLLCRRLGIPAAVDFTPHWANRSQSHSWSVLIKPDGSAEPFYMGCAPGDTAHYYHPYLKPKVLRHRFSLNRDIVKDLGGEKDCPALFKNPDFIDVTDEYYITSDIVCDAPTYKVGDAKAAYICVFDNREWVPVYYGKIRSGKVIFKSMVRNVAYIAATYRNGKVIPFGNPFILQSDGRVREIKADPSSYQSMTLLRKYPFMGRQDHFNGRMNGGRFQCSNTLDFIKTTDIHKHEGLTEGNWNDIRIDDPTPYRFFRYIGPNGSHCNINEIELYSPEGALISGEIIGTTGVPGKTREQVFDGDILTGFEGDSPDGHWVGMKFKKPVKIGRIRYIPRNDGNCIEIGDKYELMQWREGRWESLGERTATCNALEYERIPSGGLYVLRNLTKGHEERIFTYENGKQIWW